MKNKPVSLGRIPASEREARHQRVLQAAQEELTTKGYDQTTMLSVAKRANCSKATLYEWFGDRQGLFTAVIERNGDLVAEQVAVALEQGKDAKTVLNNFGYNLLRLLCGEQSVELNRAAAQSPELAKILLASGRFRVGPLVENYLQTLFDKHGVTGQSSETAFSVFYGLIVLDTQIRVLLGDKAPSDRRLKSQASNAVDHFFTLYGLQNFSDKREKR